MEVRGALDQNNQHFSSSSAVASSGSKWLNMAQQSKLLNIFQSLNFYTYKNGTKMQIIDLLLIE